MRNSNYKTGLFTSPHLFDVRERIRINGYVTSALVISVLVLHSGADSSIFKEGRL